MSDSDDDDADDDVIDEQTAKDFAGFIAEPGDEVNDTILSFFLFMCILFAGRRGECR